MYSTINVDCKHNVKPLRKFKTIFNFRQWHYIMSTHRRHFFQRWKDDDVSVCTLRVRANALSDSTSRIESKCCHVGRGIRQRPAAVYLE